MKIWSAFLESAFGGLLRRKRRLRGPRSINFRHQLDSRECGAACLAMICDHYRLEYSRQYLQNLCRRDRQGLSLANLSAAAEDLGFRCRMVKARVEDLVEHAPLPAIAFWPRKHFVVVYNVRGSNVSVADPAFGRITYKLDDFRSRWTFQSEEQGALGVLLLLTPASARAPRNTQEESPTKLILPYLSDYRPFVSQVAFCGVAALAAYLTLPWIAAGVVDLGIRRNDGKFIRLLLTGQLIAIVWQAAAQGTQNWLLAIAGNRINLRFTGSFLSKLARVPLSFFDQQVHADLVQRVGDHYRIQDFLNTSIAQAVLVCILIMVFGLALYANRPKFLLIYAIGGTAYVLAMVVLVSQRRSLDYERFEMSARSHGALLEYLNGIHDLRLCGAEKSGQQKWQEAQQRLSALNNRLAGWDQVAQVAGAFISGATTLLITLSASGEVSAGTMSLGRFFAVQFIIGQLNAPLAQIIDVLRRWQDATLTLERIANVHHHCEEWNGEAIVGLSPTGIEFANVCFGYGGNSVKQILSNVSFELPKGKTTAVVGPSGSGKTTLLKLLLGFYPPDGGTITVGGKNLQAISPSDWRSRCGVVMQDGFLFSDTISNNIVLGCKDCDPEHLLEVLQMVRLEEFVASLPCGVETQVGSDGVGLSRGQVLRILIARALYRNPEFLFLDEATSALDAETEAAVVENLKATTRNKTVVIIAHRLSTVRYADQIIVLDNGRVVEVGSHDSLIACRGKYHRLIRNQLELNTQ